MSRGRRRAMRWAAATAALAALWVGTIAFHLRVKAGHTFVLLETGRLIAGRLATAEPAGVEFGRGPRPPLRLSAGWLNDPPRVWLVVLPLWIPPVLAAMWTGIAWWRTRQESAGGCEKCGYDLQGVDGGVCPECGAGAARMRTTKEPCCPRMG